MAPLSTKDFATEQTLQAIRHFHDQRPAICLLALLVALVCAVPSRSAIARPASQTRSSAFRPAECGPLVELPLGMAPGRDVECGYASVPEQHSLPDGPTIELAVVILKSTGPSPRPDPLVMAQGGPGGSTIDTYAALLLDSPLRAERDIVLFDQRGTLHSRPALLCPERMDVTLRTIEQNISREEEDRLGDEALLACRARLLREGANLAAFDSLENAADVDALRAALGYDTINLYGVSYGTLLALHVMRDFPGGLRSVILDSVAPPQINFLEQAARSENRALTEFFGACAADERCNAAFPDLERVFYDHARQLDGAPARAPMTDAETGKTYSAVVRGDTFQGLIFQMLYSTELLPLLPQLIYDARAGRYEVFGRIASLLVFDRTVAEGMYFSVVCAEDADFDPADATGPDLRPAIAERAERDARDLVELCRRWEAPPLGSEVDRPVASDVPTLVLTGRFDPITPPQFAAQTAQTLPRSYLYTFPNAGHGVFQSVPCADQIVASFLGAPTARPADSCAASLGAPRFIIPADVLRVPSLIRLLNLEGNSTAELAIFGGALLALLSAWLALPLAWLIRRLRRDAPRPAPPLARALPWLALLLGALLLFFAVALVAGVVRSAEQQALLLLGVPRSMAALFVLPPIGALLAAAMLAGMAAAWRSGAWSLAQRLYHTLLALAGAVCVALLAVWGMVGAPFVR
jgi:pimeloyl-ACP methyl ester carboxylesterase